MIQQARRKTYVRASVSFSTSPTIPIFSTLESTSSRDKSDKSIDSFAHAARPMIIRLARAASRSGRNLTGPGFASYPIISSVIEAKKGPTDICILFMFFTNAENVCFVQKKSLYIKSTLSVPIIILLGNKSNGHTDVTVNSGAEACSTSESSFCAIV